MWNRELYVREQQDAYEFFTSLVDQLDEYLKVQTPAMIQKQPRINNEVLLQWCFLSNRKWAENRSSKTHFKESSLIRRFVKIVLTGKKGQISLD